jgi:hypothetical protein
MVTRLWTGGVWAEGPAARGKHLLCKPARPVADAAANTAELFCSFMALAVRACRLSSLREEGKKRLFYFFSSLSNPLSDLITGDRAAALCGEDGMRPPRSARCHKRNRKRSSLSLASCLQKAPGWRQTLARPHGVLSGSDARPSYYYQPSSRCRWKRKVARLARPARALA